MTWLVLDPRFPAATVYGSGSGSTLNSATNAVYVDSYLKPGLNDGRSTAPYRGCLFLGKGAFADMEPEPVHYETENQGLKKFAIKGAVGSRGFTRATYKKSTETVATNVNQSSGILWVATQTATFK
jgi:hypothetical protein